MTATTKRPASSILASITQSYSTKRVRRVSLAEPQGVPYRLRQDDPVVSSDDDEATPHRNVRFDPRVRYYAIDSHRLFSAEEKQSIWTCRQDLRTQAVRNRREFAYEGHDWRDVVLEDDFCWDGEQLVHPVHVDETSEASHAPSEG